MVSIGSQMLLYIKEFPMAHSQWRNKMGDNILYYMWFTFLLQSIVDVWTIIDTTSSVWLRSSSVIYFAKKCLRNLLFVRRRMSMCRHTAVYRSDKQQNMHSRSARESNFASALEFVLIEVG